jgi:hypothetical protein
MTTVGGVTAKKRDCPSFFAFWDSGLRRDDDGGNSVNGLLTMTG